MPQAAGSLTTVPKQSYVRGPRLGVRHLPQGKKKHQLANPRSKTKRRAVFTAFVDEMAAEPGVFVSEIAAVVLLSSVFEKGERWMKTQMMLAGDEVGISIIDALFKELTGLGFVGLFLYLITQTGTVDLLADKVLGIGDEGANPIGETFEVVHMMIFLLMLVLLFQAFSVLLVSRQVSDSWDQYERARTWGEAETSLEYQFAKGGLIEQVPCENCSRGVEIRMKKPLQAGETVWDRLLSRSDPLVKLVTWRAIRHEFLFPSESERDGRVIQKVPDVSNFSFESYLNKRLGETVLGLVEVDIYTWGLTVLFMIPVVYYAVTQDFLHIEELQCAVAWSLLTFAALMTVVLAEDRARLTPKMPSDPRQLLRIFAGTSSVTMRSSMQAMSATSDAVTPKDDIFRGLALGTPSIAGVDDLPEPKFGRPSAFDGDGTILSSETYMAVFRAIAFFQALSVTSLIVTYLSRNFDTPMEIGLYALAWAEWPVMLFFAVPAIIRRLTIRNSIETEKCEAAIRSVTIKTKSGVLQNYMRLIQIIEFERRAAQSGERWASKDSGWTVQDASEQVENSVSKFRALSQSDKLEIWKIFESWDVNNDESVEASEVTEVFKQMGFKTDVSTSICNLLRVVDNDGTSTLTWRKFKALIMLATEDRPEHEVIQDIDKFFDVIDSDCSNIITVPELANWSKRIRIFLDEEDFAHLCFEYFGQAKYTLNRTEFREWIQSIVGSEAGTALFR